MSSVPNPATTPWVPLWDTGSGGSAKPSSIPGEVKLWSGKVLPLLVDYGLWVWADGTAYAAATYPKAAGNIATEWKTAHGQSDPGAGMFRVPDLRGLTPVGLDQMPGGSRANRTTRTVAITIAAKTGEETHIVAVAEMPPHAHVVASHSHGGGTGYMSADHTHGIGDPGHSHGFFMNIYSPGDWPNYMFQQGSQGGVHGFNAGQSAAMAENVETRGTGIWTGGVSANHYHGITAEAPGTDAQGNGTAHETMQPSVFVPYIVALDS